ncbi:MAG: peroxide stress protein YaaA [Gemmiger sp.]
MKIIISPAKKMSADPDSLPWRELPEFLPRTEQLLARLRTMEYDELKKLWKCSDQIARQNVQRLQTMELRRGLTPALFAYDGIQYRYMAPDVFTDRELDYVQEHLRILSGFYGVLRPFDGVTPYRLEMQAKLSVNGEKDLYGFWSDSVAQTLWAQTDCVIDLASREYSHCVPRRAGKRWITCVFGEKKDGRIVEKGTQCKMARGAMVRYLAERQAQQPEPLKDFRELGYRYDAARSAADRYVFVKQKAGRKE